MRKDNMIFKISNKNNLYSAFEKVKRKKKGMGLDNQSIKDIEKNIDSILEKISIQLLNSTYRPGIAKKVLISKKGKNQKRAIFIMNNKDKIVQNAILKKIDPIFDKEFSKNSFAFRHNRSYLNALDLSIQYLNEGYIYILKIDIQSFFDEISHDMLIDKIGKKIDSKKTIIIIKRYLKQKFLYNKKFKVNKLGLLQGSAMSPLFANIYLNDLDQTLEKSSRIRFVRYADDLLILSKKKIELENILKKIAFWLNKYKLKMNLDKTSVLNINKKESFDFLGYRFKNHNIIKI